MPARSLREWRAPADQLDLESGEIHVWRACLRGNMSTLPALRRKLAPIETEKSRRFRLERDRSRYVFAHGVLRTVLERYLGPMPPEPVFRFGPAGKPELRTGKLRFNMSRADDLVLCAVTRVAEVGVDVERVRSGGVDALTRWLCSPTTNHLLDALPQSVRERAFFRGWTRMEAHSKARGEGLTLERAIFERFLDLHHPTNAALVRDGVSHDGWWLHDFSPRRGYVAAVAARGAKLRVSNWIWHVDSTL